MVQRRDFRPKRLDLFWQFVHDRQAVWYRRVVAGEEPPWTDDPVLQRHRFTNAYRVLDPGTQYAIQAILGRDAPRPDKLFNVLFYRLVGRQATHEAVGFLRLDELEATELDAAMRTRRDEDGEPVFTGAYTVSGYAGMGGADKIANVARLFEDIHDRFGSTYAAVHGSTDPEAAYAAIRSLPGFGTFLAYQVLVDLLYPLPPRGDESFLPFSPDVWAVAGPGAARGLSALLDESAECSELAAMRWLWRNQAAELDRLDLEFDWLRDEDGERIPLSLADVQNCCCEYYKWRKTRVGEGRTRRRFRPEERRNVEELREVYAGYPVSVAAKRYPESGR